VIGLLLGACGAPSGERPLGEEDYLLELTGSLPVSDFDPGATFWAYSLESRPGEGVYSTAYEPGFAVDTSTGGYAVSVDARSLATAALTPEALIAWYYRDYDGEGFTVSNPDARIQVIGWVELHQRVPTGDGWHYSHDIKMIERYMDGETERRASGYPMFSDAPVRIEGQVTPAGAGSPATRTEAGAGKLDPSPTNRTRSGGPRPGWRSSHRVRPSPASTTSACSRPATCTTAWPKVVLPGASSTKAHPGSSMPPGGSLRLPRP